MAGRVFDWRQGNSFALLCDGVNFFPRMLHCIDQARSQVELELYLIETGHCAAALLQALMAAAQRGVRVRCLFDGYGGQGLQGPDRARLLAAGVELRWYNPLGWQRGLGNFYRDHRKLLLVDGRQAFVGGTGATDQFWNPQTGRSLWHELMVEIDGPVVEDWQALFEHQWQVCLKRFVWPYERSTDHYRFPQRPQGDGWGRLAYADARQHRDILRSLVRAVASARQRVWLATPYFLPTWRVRRALRRAAERGVDVRLLLSGQHTDHPPVRLAGQRYYPKLLKAGVQIFEYQPRFLHFKLVMVDDWISLGSCNFDHWNLRFNLDANLEAVDAGLTTAVTSRFNEDFAASLPFDLAAWRQLSLWQRWQRQLWGWLDRTLRNWLDRRY